MIVRVHALAARETAIRLGGLIASLGTAALTAWLLATQPGTLTDVSGGLAAGVGLYRIDQAAFDEGLRYFRQDRFREARLAFARADFGHIEGGAEGAAASGRVQVDDPTLGLRSSDELRAELERGLTRELSDFNPMRVLRPRQ